MKALRRACGSSPAFMDVSPPVAPPAPLPPAAQKAPLRLALPPEAETLVAAHTPVEARFSRSVGRWLRRVVPLKVRHARTLRDRALARRLLMAFSGVPLTAHLPDLRFFIYYHTVSVYATVATQADATALVRLAETVPGVLRVVSHVRVAGGDGQVAAVSRRRRLRP